MSESTASTTASAGGVSFLSLLALLFIGLKLTDAIDWPWVLVLAPLWAPFALMLAVVCGAASVAISVFVLGSVFYLLPLYIYETLKKRRAQRLRDQGDGWVKP